VRRFRYVLWLVGLAFGVATEWIGRPELIGLDAVAGFALVFLGLSAWSRTAVGPIMAASGFTWFLGTFWSPALYVHRGPLAHLMLSFPSGRLSSRREQVAVAAAYV
jgi:predicted branched-subunit amino acid permease